MNQWYPYSTVSQENVTEPAKWVKGPFKGPDGYEGSGEHFRVRVNVIGIKNTDAVVGNMPCEELRQWTVDEEGDRSIHVLQDRNDDAYQLWTSKIGPYLADWVLGMPRHENPPWRLLKFPDNYTLWIHKKASEADRGNPRHDAYLYGAPHLGPTHPRTGRSQMAPTIFRSPMEFVPHAIWLMKGSPPGACLCKYCKPGQKQKVINRWLNHGKDNSDDEDEDEDDVNERRGRNGGAGTRPRRTKRARSPPAEIKAKDYRVGVKGGPNPSSAT